MHLRILIPVLAALVVLTLILSGCGTTPEDVLSDAPGDESLEVVPDEMIVLIHPGATAIEKATLLREAGVTELDEFSELSATLVGFDPDARDSVQEALEASLLVEEVLDNQILEEQRTPNDPLLRDQWHHDAIGSRAAWDLTTGSEEVIVAVLDSGVDVDHEDLKDNLLQGESLVDGSSWNDVRGHGTACAGIIGARSNNRTGGAGGRVGPARSWRSG